MFDRNLMKLPGMHAMMAALAILALLQAVAIAGQALSAGNAVARLWAGEPLSAVAGGIVAFFACFALLQLLRFAQETMLDGYALRQSEELRARILAETFDASSMLAQRKGTAAVAATAMEGIDDVRNYISIIPPKMVGMALISLPILGVEFAIDWPSGVILCVMFPVIIFFMVLLGRQARERAQRQYGAYTRLSNRFMDTLRGLETIQAFGAEKAEEASVYSFSERLRRATVKTLTTATLSSAVLDLCATLGVAGVAMMLAFRLMDGSVPLSVGLTALMLAPEYFAPIRAFASDFHASLDGKNALSAVLDMLGGSLSAQGRKPEEAQEDGAARIVDTLGSATSDTFTWNANSTLEFHDVGFRYDETGRGVDGISLTLHGFEHVAIVGESGSGKSTLAKLVSGLVSPASGETFLDGKPVDLACQSWKSLVRFIPQNPTIFRRSLADNIRFYNPDATDEQVARAAEVVGLEKLLQELPNGLDTPIGEGQRELSGGQAHRVALARILLDDATRIIVLDEPTAHLDIETEYELKERMLPLMEGKLVVFATHRLHWTRDMDRTITLADGRVANGDPAPQEAGNGGEK